ncbi:MAG: efflux RND transporter periplasmic adaptor subunit, partial [Rhodoferax sp.]|nr:efflux RND transporter periplasmic adaptor subunit [Rhodoferax sp.]
MNATSSQPLSAPTASTAAPADLQALLAQPPKPTWWRRRSLWIGLALLASGTAAYFYWSASQQAKAA